MLPSFVWTACDIEVHVALLWLAIIEDTINTFENSAQFMDLRCIFFFLLINCM